MWVELNKLSSCCVFISSQKRRADHCISNNDLASVRPDPADIMNLPISLTFQISRRACASSSTEAMDVQGDVFILYNRIHPVDLVKRKISAIFDVSACVFLSRSDVEKNCVFAFTEASDSLVYVLESILKILILYPPCALITALL